ncbi:hypothetical protein [Geodermatophilus sp. URMC 64]
MSEKSLANAHRRIADAEHRVERMMLDQADDVSDPADMRQRAHEISANARDHEKSAKRIERRAERSGG